MKKQKKKLDIYLTDSLHKVTLQGALICNQIKDLSKQGHKLKAPGGFTLIEMVVVMAIITIFTAIVTLDLRSGNRNLALQRSGQTITQTIEKAKTFSLGGKLHKGTVSRGGYGVRFERVGVPSERILFFADCNGNGRYDAPGAAPTSCDKSDKDDPSTFYDEFVDFIILEEGTKVHQINKPGCVASGNPQFLEITFKPPDPDTIFYSDGTPTCEEPFIRVQSKATGDEIRIYINLLGVTRIQ